MEEQVRAQGRSLFRKHGKVLEGMHAPFLLDRQGEGGSFELSSIEGSQAALSSDPCDKSRELCPQEYDLDRVKIGRGPFPAQHQCRARLRIPHLLSCLPEGSTVERHKPPIAKPA